MERSSSSVEIVVRDNGQGTSDVQIAHAFDRDALAAMRTAANAAPFEPGNELAAQALLEATR